MQSLQYAKYFTQTISFNKHNNVSLLILSSPSFSFGENEIALQDTNSVVNHLKHML